VVFRSTFAIPPRRRNYRQVSELDWEQVPSSWSAGRILLGLWLLALVDSEDQLRAAIQARRHIDRSIDLARESLSLEFIFRILSATL